MQFGRLLRWVDKLGGPFDVISSFTTATLYNFSLCHTMLWPSLWWIKNTATKNALRTTERGVKCVYNLLAAAAVFSEFIKPIKMTLLMVYYFFSLRCLLSSFINPVFLPHTSSSHLKGDKSTKKWWKKIFLVIHDILLEALCCSLFSCFLDLF